MHCTLPLTFELQCCYHRNSCPAWATQQLFQAGWDSDDFLNSFFLAFFSLKALSSTAEVNRQWKQDQDEYASLRLVGTEETKVLKNENKKSQMFHLVHFAKRQFEFLFQRKHLWQRFKFPFPFWFEFTLLFLHVLYTDQTIQGIFFLRANNDILWSKTKIPQQYCIIRSNLYNCYRWLSQKGIMKRCKPWIY